MQVCSAMCHYIVSQPIKPHESFALGEEKCIPARGEVVASEHVRVFIFAVCVRHFEI